MVRPGAIEEELRNWEGLPHDRWKGTTKEGEFLRFRNDRATVRKYLTNQVAVFLLLPSAMLQKLDSSCFSEGDFLGTTNLIKF